MAKRYGFGKKERLLKRGEFEKVFKEGRSAQDRVLKVYYLSNALGYSRLGIVVGKAVRSSVARNRLKRLCREAFRLNKHNLPKGLDIIIIPKTTDVSLEMVTKGLLYNLS